MSIRTYGILASTAAAIAIACSAPTQALSPRECSAKYKAAQSAGTLNGMKWNDFRKAECGATAAATAPPPAPAPEAAAPTKRAATAPAASPRTGNAMFPAAVSPKYSSETAGKARMHTCLDQYRANKASNGNGGLRWIEKGGGYYSECNKRLSSQ